MLNVCHALTPVVVALCANSPVHSLGALGGAVGGAGGGTGAMMATPAAGALAAWPAEASNNGVSRNLGSSVVNHSEVTTQK